MGLRGSPCPGGQVLRVLHSTPEGKNVFDDPILPRGESLGPFQGGSSWPGRRQRALQWGRGLRPDLRLVHIFWKDRRESGLCLPPPQQSPAHACPSHTSQESIPGWGLQVRGGTYPSVSGGRGPVGSSLYRCRGLGSCGGRLCSPLAAAIPKSPSNTSEPAPSEGAAGDLGGSSSLGSSPSVNSPPPLWGQDKRP